MDKVALIIAPDWNVGGSNHIFAAQIEYYRSKGLKALLLLVPDFKSGSDLNGSIKSELTADHVTTVHLPYLLKQFLYRVSKYVKRYPRNDVEHRNYITRRGSIDAATQDYISKRQITEICVNWCDNVDLSVFLREKFATPQVPIIVHTHDIMAVHSKNPSRTKELELSWLRKADCLVHVSEDDHLYFSGLIDCPQFVTYITLKPIIEKNLNSVNHNPKQKSVLFVGSWNHANPPSIEMFVKQVLPFIDESVSIYIAGNICDYLKKYLYWPYLINRKNFFFLDKVEDMTCFYEAASLVILPTTVGTGASVKFVEALAMGVPVVMSPLSLRGLPDELKVKLTACVASNPVDFAEKINKLLDQPESALDFRKLYWEYFSNHIWFERMSIVSASAGSLSK